MYQILQLISINLPFCLLTYLRSCYFINRLLTTKLIQYKDLEGCTLYLYMFSSIFLKKTQWFKIADFSKNYFLNGNHIYGQSCKSWNEEKLLLKLLWKGLFWSLYHRLSHNDLLTTPLNKLPWVVVVVSGTRDITFSSNSSVMSLSIGSIIDW